MRRITSICVVLLLLASVSAPAAMATARAVLHSCCPPAAQKHSCCPEMEHDCDMQAPELSFRAEPSSCCPACLVLTAGPVTSQAVTPVLPVVLQVAESVSAAPVAAVPFRLSSSSQRDRAPPASLL
jgi:hypothetical protein